MRTASRVLGFAGGILSIFVSLMFFYGMHGHSYLALLVFCFVRLVGSAAAITGGVIVPKKNIAGGMLMIAGALTCPPDFISSALLILGSVLAFIRKKALAPPENQSIKSIGNEYKTRIRKTLAKVFLICVSTLFILYTGETIFIGLEIHAIVSKSYYTFGENNPYDDTVADDIYESMCYRNGYPISANEGIDVKETNSLSFPLVINWVYGGKAVYWYSYEIDEVNGCLSGGSWRVPVTITFKIQQGRLKITDKFEAP